jgi:hypothetical protein
MKRILFTCSAILMVALFSSCSSKAGSSEEIATTDVNAANDTRILQDKDGTISLKVEKAALYHDVTDPKNNTAEWSVLVSKSGRFNVWLSSATIDTTNLRYRNNVRFNIRENNIEKRPACDKIVQNSSDVSYPYFRADSFMGSLYIQDTGSYNITVISDKILPKDYKASSARLEDSSKLISVFLTPITR